jgi:4-amino-4-deoxy-L-arabinose transferase-like glycosyltransferase
MRLSRLITCLILTLAFILLFYRLGSRPLNSWDEAVYAESAKEMVQDGDWLTPHWNHEKFLQKPPLFIWSAALLFKLFGTSEASARAMSALAGVGCVVLVLFIVRLFSTEYTALIAALILLATPGFKLNARYAMTDVMLTFFMLLAIYAYLRTKENNKWWFLVGVSCGLAVMTKGAGAIPLFVALMFMIAWKNRAAIRTKEFWLGVGLCLVIGGTWHLLMLYLHGRTFVTDYLGSQVVSRTLQLVDTPEGRYDAFFYPYFVLSGFFPACLLLPLSIPAWFKAKRLPIILPLFAATVFVLYFLATTKHQWYIVPIFPILSIIAAPLTKKVIPLFVLAIIGGLIFSASNRPSKETAAIADLSSRASMDGGPLGFYPGLLHGPEVLFYSNRPLCADAPEHSMGLLTRCPVPEYVIVATHDIPSFPGIKELARSGNFAYCRIDR